MKNKQLIIKIYELIRALTTDPKSLSDSKAGIDERVYSLTIASPDSSVSPEKYIRTSAAASIE